jgi:cytoskeletal protein CcmA (bactofilin family)
MFGRRNPDRPLDAPLPEGHDTEDLNLDLLDDLPDILEAERAKPDESAPPAPAPDVQPAAPAPDPAWQASAPSILGPSVTRMLQTRPEEEAVPRTDLSSPPPRTPTPSVFQPPPPAAAPAAAPDAAITARLTPEPASRPRAVAESVIGPDDFFDGRYRSERGVRIQGNARGSIESRQYIFVEAGAQVEADLSAEDITISGDFKGKISCRRRLEVTGTGKIQGQVQTALLEVQEGGALDGELHMRGDQAGAAEGE